MNGSLITDPEAGAIDQALALAQVRDEVVQLCGDASLWCGQIADGIQNIACRYDDTLGDKTEYQLLQAVGSEIAYPKASLWRQVAPYYNRANKCSDAEFARATGLFRHYANLRIELLEFRAGLSGGRIDADLRQQYEQAVVRAKESPRL